MKKNEVTKMINRLLGLYVAMRVSCEKLFNNLEWTSFFQHWEIKNKHDGLT